MTVSAGLSSAGRGPWRPPGVPGADLDQPTPTAVVSGRLIAPAGSASAHCAYIKDDGCEQPTIRRLHAPLS
jgi:hypothetical protein